jgi:hypothetical protein
MFTEEEKKWIDKCKKFPTLYQIVVDNDSIWIDGLSDDVGDDKLHDTTFEFSFHDYGEDFILNLLKYIGCSADGC